MRKDKVNYTLWDIAGGKNYRKVWHNYIEEATLIVYFIDASDQSTQDEVAESLRAVLEDPNVKGRSMVFFMNKSVEKCLTKDRESFNSLTYQDLIKKLSCDKDIRVFIEDLCCLEL